MEFKKYLFIFKNLNLRFLRFLRNCVFFIISIYLYGFFFPNLVFTIIVRFINLLKFWVDYYGISFYFERIFNIDLLISYCYIFIEWSHSYLSDKFSFYQIFSNFIINLYNSSLDFIFSFNFFLFFVLIFFVFFCIYFFLNLLFIIYILSKRFFNFFLFFSEYYYYKKEDLVFKSSFSNLVKFLLWLEQEEISNRPKELIFKSTQELNKFDWSNVYFLFYAYQNWQDLEKEEMDSVLEDDVLTFFDTNQGPAEALDYSEEEETAEQDLEFPVWFLFVNDKEFDIDLNYLELHEDLDDPISRHKIYPRIFSKTLNLNLYWFNKIPKWFLDLIFIKEALFLELFNFFIFSSPFLYKLNKGLRILRLWLNLIYWDWLYVFKYFSKSSWLILYAKLKKKLFFPFKFIMSNFKIFYYNIRKSMVYLILFFKQFVIAITNCLVLMLFILLGFIYTYILFIYFFFKNVLLTLFKILLNIFWGFTIRLRSILLTFINLVYGFCIYPVWFIFIFGFLMLCYTFIFIFMCLYYIVFRVLKLFKYVFSILDYVYDRGYLKNEVKKLLYEKPILEPVYIIYRIVSSKILNTKLGYVLKRSGWCRKGNYLERNKIYQTVSIDLVKIEAPLKLINAPPRSEQNQERKGSLR